jgi:anti-sigma factor RsiW
MANNQNDNPDDNDRLTELVAYLDAELDDAQMNEVEVRLLKDPQLRTLADDLERTWGLLDSLEEVTASSQFTQQTLATVSSESLQAEAASNQKPAAKSFTRFLSDSRFRQAAAWFVAGIAGTLLGLIVSRSLQQDVASPDRMILQNLDLLQRYPRYLPVPNTEQLEQLPSSEAESLETGDSP